MKILNEIKKIVVCLLVALGLIFSACGELEPDELDEMVERGDLTIEEAQQYLLDEEAFSQSSGDESIDNKTIICCTFRCRMDACGPSPCGDCMEVCMKSCVSSSCDSPTIGLPILK